MINTKKYFDEIKELLLSSSAEIVVIVGPGFTEDDLFSYLKDIGERIVVESCSNTGKTRCYGTYKERNS